MITEQSDQRLNEATEVLITHQRASVAVLQRHFRLAYAEACDLMGALERRQVVTPVQDGIRRLTPAHEAPETRLKARFVRAVFETVRFFWEMWEEDAQGHTGAIRLLKPTGSVGNVELRKLVLDEYYRQRRLTLPEAGSELVRWLNPARHGPALDEADMGDLTALCASAARAFSRTVDEEAILLRSFTRLARFLYSEYLDGGSAHSRCFEYFVATSQTPQGQGRNGGSYLEHVVPLAFLRRRCFARFAEGASVAEAAAEIRPFLIIVKITVAEKERLDNGPALGGFGWRDTMPEGWSFEAGDPYARLRLAGIAFAPPGEAQAP